MSEDRLRIWAARLAAPAAFFFAAIVLVALVQGALSADDAESDGTPPAAASTPTGTEPVTTTEPDGQRPRRRFYRVRAGDTLVSIAERFRTTEEELLELNPGIDPLELQPGQRIRLRRG
ncbi:MAG TPA: LysM domain-containing protein [Gaiellaceae bacterium]|nr:LysM domain-containing protein [Gaiellaceae bacterium]